jgi:5-methylcytosine-specific restriction endonuclease McrA
MTIYRLCPRCPNKVIKPGLCPDCKRERERARPTRTQRGLDNRWLRLSAQAIRERPYCEYCGATQDLTGDHRIPRSQGGVARSTADIIVACRRCNASRGNRGGQSVTWSTDVADRDGSDRPPVIG